MDKQEVKITCKRCGKEFTLVLPARIAEAMEDIRREGTEPVGTCPPCKIENPDPIVKLLRDAGIVCLTDEVKADA